MQSEPQNARTLVWALPLSLAATSGITFVFSSSGYLDVSVHRVPHTYLWIQYVLTEVSSAGFPHSDICGSLDICSSPQLFAAYHVFHRLLVPRHPPCALISFIESFFFDFLRLKFSIHSVVSHFWVFSYFISDISTSDNSLFPIFSYRPRMSIFCRLIISN